MKYYEKPVYSVRLEELIKEQGIKKNEFAKKVFTTPQTISKACQGIRLTRETAENIIKEYPQYNIGWLLGYSPLKYKADVDKAFLDTTSKEIISMPDELTPYAVELITKCPQLINMFAAKINRMINNWDGCDPDHTEVLEPIEISHVGYSMEQCGYDK